MAEENTIKSELQVIMPSIEADICYKVVEASPDANLVINESGKIVVFNQQAEFMFGYSRLEVVGKEVEILMSPSLHDIHIKNRRKYFDQPRVREMGIGQILLGRYKTGREFKIEIKLAPMIVAGAGVHALAVIRKVDDKE